MKAGRHTGRAAVLRAIAGALAIAYASACACAAAQSTERPAQAVAVPPAVALPNFAALVRRVGPAVVNISVTREVTQMGIQLPLGIAPDHPLAPFLARRVIGNREEVSLGSGFIVSADGVILTNRHVVGDAVSIDVKLTDKRQFKGRVIGSDPVSDVAVIRIDAHNLPVVATGDPARTEVGDWVMAIGSPYGFANTVTQGIVSAKSRSLPGERAIPFIQTDVPINPGNSGGPLFDLAGRVIAINSMIFSKTGGYQGLAFAIPIDIALDVKDQLLRTGKVTRGRLGVAVQEVSQALARSFGLASPDGALITLVEPDSPAARAGLQAGDVVLAVDGRLVAESADLLGTVAGMRAGRQADLLVWRAGRAMHVIATVAAVDSGTTPAGAEQGPARFGLALRAATEQERLRLGIGQALVVEQASGQAARAGLQPGDIVLSVNGTPVASIGALMAGIDAAHGNVALLVQRGGTRLYLPIEIGRADPASKREAG
ncbi:MAG: Do family serine endopeptidase [Burkholderia sp.]|jgi:serine protease Do|uniref:Do family serine endopeptidase n=2 Tax=Burkholderia sp. TaxID=36773 RepID=UPI00258A9480|nr:Do family serine endopeptidase [Burkholderia sp.]MCA3781913.1 Do family serine endopeptidase [Burkholderia sp.]MCA3787833.1 Do family serine endopeptidase [Burkholderia sp.]MCA3791606.1 Do family serine endopeptidase [Burkholderia sp.]MCA3820051.1 Do family serine endopeptidase [Burkholderia sp.]MCA3824617.1 Do family serine endopeptidase [Burkholderia sp.]